MDRLTKAFIALAAIGIAVAVYHGYDEVTSYTGPGSTVCNLSSFVSCSSVFASGDVAFPPGPYGLPLYIYGLVWFPLMVVLGFWYGRKKGTLNGEVLFPVLMVGNLFTIYLWYVELGVIHALCPVCISMYLLNYAMTAAGAKALLSS
ncbi:MAG: vitamin K epoxide reductase family protein [Thaumarchaeota archaeon]|nr:vitamin K epoxide reductase family protein [Nitrososphaerota archaeon]